MTKPDELSTEEKAGRAPKITPEQAAMLASATMVDSGLVADVLPHDEEGNPLPPEAAPADRSEGNRTLLQFLVTAASPAMPFLAECYTPDVIGQIAGAFTAVEDKYGWDIGSNIGPEFALAIFTIPPTIAAVQLGRAHFAELRAKREDAARAVGGPGRPEVGLADATKGAIGG